MYEKKVLILLKKLPGGVGSVVKSITEELKKKGYIVKILSREDDLKIYSLLRSIFPIRNEVNKAMKKEGYDIIYTQDWSTAFPLIFPWPLFNEKHFCCFHGNQLGKTKFLQTIIGRILGEKLIVVGDSLKKRFPKATLIYNGVDLNKFKDLHKKRNYLGWIDKGGETLNKREILDLSKKLNLKPLIAEKYSIPFDKMNENFYNKCKIFISFPPKTAGFNLCWLEAMAAGVPIIIGSNDGIGWKLPINKFKSKEDFFNNLNNLKEENYRKYLIKSDLTWKSHVNKLISLWKKKC